MRAIFTDVDGVLNHQHDRRRDWSQDERFGLAPDLVENLKSVLDDAPDAQLVISSSWRYFHDNMGLLKTDGDWHDELAKMLGIPRSRMEDAPTVHEFSAPRMGAKGRAHDILLWLSEKGAGDPYVVLDDECKELKRWLGGHVLDCADDDPRGLTRERAQKAVELLRAGNRVSRPTQPAVLAAEG